MASQITGISIICSTVCSRADQGKHQSSVSLAFVKRIHRWPLDATDKGPVTRIMFPFDDVITLFSSYCNSFDNRVPVNQIYWCPISKWVAVIWQDDGLLANLARRWHPMSVVASQITGNSTVCLLANINIGSAWGESTGHRWNSFTKSHGPVSLRFKMS